MRPESLPPFQEGRHYRQLHPTREGGKRWRFVTMRPTRLKIIGIVPLGTVISFRSADGVERGRIDYHGIVLAEGYAWNGCSPKRWVWPFGWMGTPDWECTRLASGFHDLLYQFARTEHFPLNRSDVDSIFYHCIEMSGDGEMAGIYHGAVRKFGSWTDKPRNGEYSVLL
jgi:hypothetical protein